MQSNDGVEAVGLVGLLVQDHAEARRLMASFDDTPPDQRAEAFRHLVRTLVAHETAEERVFYPALRDCAAGGDAIARDRLAEQEHAERALLELERAGVEDPGFTMAFEALRRAVLEHAEHEEKTAFWVVASNLDAATLDQLAQRYVAAKRMAPTHPHPLAPDTAPANRLAAPGAAVLDRARDVVIRYRTHRQARRRRLQGARRG